MNSLRKSLSFGPFVPNSKALEKKIPANPKFKDVKPAVDTGKHVRRFIDSLREQHKNNHRNEIYKRIKLWAFVKLVVAVAMEWFNEQDQAGEKEAKKPETGGKNMIQGKPYERNPFYNLIMGIGEMDLRNERKITHVVTEEKENKRPYLILDVRDHDEYLKCHIISAINYPAAMLSRTVNYETPQLLKFKNTKGHLIILYDDDELIASRVAKTLVERGYENVFLLSGGLKQAVERFPVGLVECTPPKPCSVTYEMHLGAAPNKNNLKEHFSREDIANLQQYVDGNPFLLGQSKKSYAESDLTLRKNAASCSGSTSHIPAASCSVASSRRSNALGSVMSSRASSVQNLSVLNQSVSTKASQTTNSHADPRTSRQYARTSRQMTGRKTPWK